MDRERQTKGHLILSRRCTERLLIGEDVIVEVVLIDGGRVKLGIVAPLDVRIMREELIAPRDRPSRGSYALPAASRFGRNASRAGGRHGR